MLRRFAARTAASAALGVAAGKTFAVCDGSSARMSRTSSLGLPEFATPAGSDWSNTSQRMLADGLADWVGNLEYETALRSLRQSFALPLTVVDELRAHFAAEARAGLAGEPSSLAMLPTFVTNRVTGNEIGDFFALDLGGTNFRVLRLRLEGSGKLGAVTQAAYLVSDEIKTGTGEALFGFIADSVAHFLATKCDNTLDGVLGFTFSFPCHQTTLNSGELLTWNKGFSASGVIGEDVVKLLQDQLIERGIRLRIEALCNDTVGTMEAAAYMDPRATVGIIFGTGTNGAYIERRAAITKGDGPPSEEMVVNTEWGNLDMRRFMNDFDRQLDAKSSNPGKQTFEKMVSGLYLGEVFRLAITSPQVLRALSPECAAAISTSLGSRGSLPSASMAVCEGDISPQLTHVDGILRQSGIPSTFRDRVLVRDACICVSSRAARLAAMSIVGIVDLKNQNAQAPSVDMSTTVAVDGTVFECYPYFKERMEASIQEMIGRERASNVNLVLAKDGSGIGAAIIAAIARQ